MSCEIERAAEMGDGDSSARAWPDPRVRRQMLAVREALRLQRVARDLCLEVRLYDEHCLFGPAKAARSEMMQSLRAARTFWRLALGIRP